MSYVTWGFGGKNRSALATSFGLGGGIDLSLLFEHIEEFVLYIHQLKEIDLER